MRRRADNGKLVEIGKARRFLDADQTADWLGIKKRTLYNSLSTGEFTVAPKKWGRKLRWDIKDLEKYADSL